MAHDRVLQPQRDIPIHPIHQVHDWDCAAGAIDWPRFAAFLRQVKATGVIPSDHRSHDHLNEEKDIPVSDECRRKWTSEFDAFGENTIWIIVDGFLLYWHPVSS
jgi:nicotinamide/nicotinate riboside kinase